MKITRKSARIRSNVVPPSFIARRFLHHHFMGNVATEDDNRPPAASQRQRNGREAESESGTAAASSGQRWSSPVIRAHQRRRTCEYRCVVRMGDVALPRTPAVCAEKTTGAEAERSCSGVTTAVPTMAAAEAAREDGIDAVSIVTPNHVHYPAAKAFLEAGIPVICDKPLTSNGEDARALAEVAEHTGTAFVLTHNYTGYPMIRQAREMIERGDLGDLRLIHVEYIQDWLSEDLESEGIKQAEWRTDPKQAGAGGAIGDIGTHAFNLVSFTTQKQVERLSAQLYSFVKGRRLDDNAHVILDYAGGTKGVLLATQVAPGYENEIRLRVSGTKGSIEWSQSSSNYLRYSPLGAAPQPGPCATPCPVHEPPVSPGRAGATMAHSNRRRAL